MEEHGARRRGRMQLSAEEVEAALASVHAPPAPTEERQEAEMPAYRRLTFAEKAFASIVQRAGLASLVEAVEAVQHDDQDAIGTWRDAIVNRVRSPPSVKN